MLIQTNIPLAPYTSLNVGGNAHKFAAVSSARDITAACGQAKQLWVLGYGTNSLISDDGLDSTVLQITGGTIERTGHTLIADSGVWWDDLVLRANEEKLWGIECMSAIPGGVGGAIVGNIAAYGQAISHTLDWIEVLDTKSGDIKTMSQAELHFGYRYSILQKDTMRHLVILRAAFKLSPFATGDVAYQKAIDAADESDYDLSTLKGRRDAVILARKYAGSLWDYRDKIHDSNNAGSFFRNPLVTPEQVAAIIAHDESGITSEQIKKMNMIHGGDSLRVSAAHVMLAAGFNRGQQWGNVRLHPDHVLKVETLESATAQEVYSVVHEITSTTMQKLGIELVPEPRFMGTFQ